MALLHWHYVCPRIKVILAVQHMTSPLLSHFQPNVSDEYSTEEFSHPTALNYCQQPSMFSTVMGVASLQIQARVLSTIVFSGSILLQFSAKIASQRFLAVSLLRFHMTWY